jgi:hypothetical protein
MTTPLKTKVRITASGMMDYRAEYSLSNDKETPFELTLKQTHLDDLLTTLRLKGDIDIVQPLTFSATNAEDTNLAIAVTNPIESLITGMPGAKLRVKTSASKNEVTGRNMGIDKVDQVMTGDRVVVQRFLTLLDGFKVSRIPMDTIEDFGFVEATDQSELSKALDRLNNTIRPGTTMVRFALQGKGKPGGETAAALKWVEPDAAPLMTYRLSIDRDNKFRLEGWACIHNFTNQPWEDTTVELVSGQPHTFSGDSAVATKPIREQRNLVDATVVGGRTVTAGMGAAVAALSVAKRAVSPSGGVMLMNAAPQMASWSAEGVSDYESSRGLESTLSAPELEEAEIYDQGGMQRLICPSPVKLLESKKSTLVFMFSRPLSEASTVLVYNEANGPKPDRTFRLTNTIGVPRSLMVLTRTSGWARRFSRRLSPVKTVWWFMPLT